MSDQVRTRSGVGAALDERTDGLDAADPERWIRSSGPVLLSRVAEHLYWAGRYLERVECSARLVKAHTELFVDLPRSVGLGWAPLLAVTGSQSAFDDGFDEVTEDDVVAFVLADPANKGSVVASIEQARENLRVTRGLIPWRMWEVVNETRQWVRSTAGSGSTRWRRVTWTEEVIRRCHTVAGSTTATLSRDLGYAFLQIGRLVERADMTTRVLDVQAGIIMGTGAAALGPYTDLTWMSMLRSLGGEQMYRRQMGSVVTAPEAVRFLLRDPAFPRSVEHCLVEISRWLLELPHQEGPMAAASATDALLDSVTAECMEVDELHDFVDDLQLGLGRLHAELAVAYFPGDDPDGAP
jgi:uncharacterized alpha-E superfamily protein